MVGGVMAGNPSLKATTAINKANQGHNFSHEILLVCEAIAEMEHLPDSQEEASDRPNYPSAWLDGKSAYEIHSASGEKAPLEIEGIIAWL